MAATAKQILAGARDILSDESKWGKGGFFLDEQNHRVAAGAACKWCAYGALRKAVVDLDGCMLSKAYSDASDILENTVTAMGLTDRHGDNVYCVIEYNDAAETTHTDIITLFDRAVEAA